VADQAPNALRFQGAAQRARALIRELETAAAAIGGRGPVSEELRPVLAEKLDRSFLHYFDAAQLDALARRQFHELVRQGARCPALQLEALLAAFAEWFPEYAAHLVVDDVRALIGAYRPPGGARGRGASKFQGLLAATFEKMGIRTSDDVMREVLRGNRRSRRKR